MKLSRLLDVLYVIFLTDDPGLEGILYTLD